MIALFFYLRFGVQLIFYDTWSTLFYRINAICSPAELHGYVCGVLASAQRLNSEQWLNQAKEFMDLLEEQLPEEESAAIEGFYELALNSIADGELGFKLLLPEDELPLVERVAALGSWVEAFLHGFGTAGKETAQKLSQEGRETLNDLASIALVSIDDKDESDANEQDLIELSEFVRLSISSLFFELNREDSSETQTH